MDRRDRAIWVEAATRRYALDQINACQAAAWPQMDEDARKSYMQRLIKQYEGRPETDPNKPTPEQEAEWAANRAELAAMFGRKK